jgi:hypothetical protein
MIPAKSAVSPISESLIWPAEANSFIIFYGALKNVRFT